MKYLICIELMNVIVKDLFLMQEKVNLLFKEE